MKVLVTVGTTRFDSLISAVEHSLILNQHEVLVQCAEGLQSERYNCTKFIENIDEAYCSADLVITHAGAGSVFRLLECEANILVVPNLERQDDHQNELARFVDENQYGLVCYDVEQLDTVLQQATTFRAAPYKKSEFHAASEIATWIRQIYQ